MITIPQKIRTIVSRSTCIRRIKLQIKLKYSDYYEIIRTEYNCFVLGACEGTVYCGGGESTVHCGLESTVSEFGRARWRGEAVIEDAERYVLRAFGRVRVPSIIVLFIRHF